MPTIYWAGDSTVKQNTILTYPQTGIGQMFPLFLKPTVRIENHAENGRSTKSFIDEGRLAPIYDRITKDDFLFIQFGHNDEKRLDPARYTEPEGEYSVNLEKFVNAARNKQARPVIITPLTRRLFHDPHAEYTHQGYREAAMATAKRLNVPCIDLCTLSEKLVDALGLEQTAKLYLHVPAGEYPHFPEGKEDNTHLQTRGAVAFGELIARELYALGGVYGDLISESCVQHWQEEAAK